MVCLLSGNSSLFGNWAVYNWGQRAVILLWECPWQTNRATCTSSYGASLRETLTFQLDPYYLAPLGADYVSLGALTHSARAMDLSLEIT